MKLQPLGLKALVIAMATAGLALSMTANAKLSGAIFTTTPGGEIVNENVHYTSKMEVFLDGGPGVRAPRTAAALPAGWYYFQVTDPSGKCLLSSTPASADTVGGSCGDETATLTVKGKGKGKSAALAAFAAEPLKCRLFYFDGEDNITLPNEEDCEHKLGSDILGMMLADGDTIQLYPFATTPNNGGVYKAWVSTRDSVKEQCGGTVGDKTGEGCGGFFGFDPSNSKTDNFKVKDRPVVRYFDIALRAFHDKNLSCDFDAGDEIIDSWELGVTDPKMMRHTYLTNDSPDMPTSFTVYGEENELWSVDQYMWLAGDKGVSPMNTPFTHFSTFGDLRDFAPVFEDGTLHINFMNPYACVLNAAPPPLMFTYRASGEDTDDGFKPGDYAVADESPDPKLTVRFGSVGFAKLKVCKSFDANGNGMHDDGEKLIAGWPVELYIPESVQIPIPFDGSLAEYTELNKRLHEAGLLKMGEELATVDANRISKKITDSYGCASFQMLLPNVKGDLSKYKISEKLPMGYSWENTSTKEVSFDVESVLSYDNGNPIVEGVVKNRSDYVDGNKVVFNNSCKVTADFDTKGYWHNKNGQDELTQADLDYVNGLKPYMSASAYFDAGDEPFDSKLEVSLFLVDNNGNASLNDHKEQLAQQLLAFIFNVRHRLSSFATQIWAGGQWLSAQEIIDMAIDAWMGYDDGQISYLEGLLDGLNNNDYVKVLVTSYDECPEPKFYEPVPY